MAADYFLKIEGIKGESKAEKHKGEIDVLSWSWGESNAGTTFERGSGGGTGKVNVQDISFVHKVDKSSPTLLQSAATGKHFPKVELSIRKADGKKPQADYLTYTFTDCIISSIYHGGGSGEPLPTESVSLNFAKIKMDYRIGAATFSGELTVPPDPGDSGTP